MFEQVLSVFYRMMVHVNKKSMLLDGAWLTLKQAINRKRHLFIWWKCRAPLLHWRDQFLAMTIQLNGLAWSTVSRSRFFHCFFQVPEWDPRGPSFMFHNYNLLARPRWHRCFLNRVGNVRTPGKHVEHIKNSMNFKSLQVGSVWWGKPVELDTVNGRHSALWADS